VEILKEFLEERNWKPNGEFVNLGIDGYVCGNSNEED